MGNPSQTIYFTALFLYLLKGWRFGNTENNQIIFGFWAHTFGTSVLIMDPAKIWWHFANEVAFFKIISLIYKNNLSE